MFGHKARILLDIVFGIPTSEVTNTCTYTQNLWARLEQCFKLVRENLGAIAERQKEYYNRRVHGEPYQEGDHVWLHNPAVPRGQSKNLYCPWMGPFKIVKCLSDSVNRIQDTHSRRRRQVVHLDRLKCCHLLPQELHTDSHTVEYSTPDVTSRNESNGDHPVLPGTNLELVDDDDNFSSNSPPLANKNLATSNTQSDIQTSRRYPIRENHQRPVRLYLGCFGWVINLIYSTLFSNILHAFRYNITCAQNLGLSNRYVLFTCSNLTSAIILSREDA